MKAILLVFVICLSASAIESVDEDFSDLTFFDSDNSTAVWNLRKGVFSCP